jgi:hypothetical protein
MKINATHSLGKGDVVCSIHTGSTSQTIVDTDIFSCRHVSCTQAKNSVLPFSSLHGLSCERCRSEALCVADVVTDLVDILASDPSAEVRHKTIAVLVRFVSRDERAGEAIARAAHEDPDSAIRHVAQAVVDSGQSHVRGRKAALRDARRQQKG